MVAGTAKLYYCPVCGAFVVPANVSGGYASCAVCAADTPWPWQDVDCAAAAQLDYEAAPGYGGRHRWRADEPDADRQVAVLDKGFVRLVRWLGDDSAIAQAARASFGKSSKSPADDARLIARLMRDRHTSPFEHVVMTFQVKAPIFVVRQWQRHRTWSYSELSQRYAEAADEFYVPAVDDIRAQSKTNKQAGDAQLDADTAQLALSFMHDAYDWSARCYKLLLRLGVSREQARIVLPVGIYTTFVGTVDLHNLFGFLRLRRAADAQAEIQAYAGAIEALIAPIVPAAYAAFAESLPLKGSRSDVR